MTRVMSSARPAELIIHEVIHGNQCKSAGGVGASEETWAVASSRKDEEGGKHELVGAPLLCLFWVMTRGKFNFVTCDLFRTIRRVFRSALVRFLYLFSALTSCFIMSGSMPCHSPNHSSANVDVVWRCIGIITVKSVLFGP